MHCSPSLHLQYYESVIFFAVLNLVDYAFISYIGFFFCVLKNKNARKIGFLCWDLAKKRIVFSRINYGNLDADKILVDLMDKGQGISDLMLCRWKMCIFLGHLLESCCTNLVHQGSSLGFID